MVGIGGRLRTVFQNEYLMSYNRGKMKASVTRYHCEKCFGGLAFDFL